MCPVPCAGDKEQVKCSRRHFLPWPKEQCSSVLALPRRAFCVWRIPLSVVWGSCSGAEGSHPGHAGPRGPGVGQGSCSHGFPTSSLHAPCLLGLFPAPDRGSLRHSLAWSCDVVSRSCSCSFLSLLADPPWSFSLAGKRGELCWG